MSFQIKDIVIYSHDGRTRHFQFRLGRLNLIVGPPKTGKTAIGALIEYCLGAKRCDVPAGVISNAVSWIGVNLSLADGSIIFVGREMPADGFLESRNIVLLHDEPALPTFESLNAAPRLAGPVELSAVLSQMIGISPSDVSDVSRDSSSDEPPSGEGYRRAQISDAMPYCFQTDEDLQSRVLVFHRQAEPEVKRNIKETLPYFLGAITEAWMKEVEQKSYCKKQIRRREKDLRSIEEAKEKWLPRIQTFVNTASELGLTSVEEFRTLNWTQARDILVKLRDNGFPEELVSRNEGDRIETDLVTEENRLREQINSIAQGVKEIDGILDAARSYRSGNGRLEGRLRVGELFPDPINSDEPFHCPACSQIVTHLPTKTNLSQAFVLMKQKDVYTDDEIARYESAKKQLQTDQDVLSRQLRNITKQLRSIREENNRLGQLHTKAQRSAKLFGNIETLLDTLPENSIDEVREGILNQELVQFRGELQELERHLKSIDVDALIGRTGSELSSRVTTLANHFDVEYSVHGLELDIKKLTLSAFGPTETIVLSRFGGASNVVGAHLAVHAGLHQLFIERNRPVPHFLFLGQLSQAPQGMRTSKGSNGNVVSPGQAMQFLQELDRFVEALDSRFQIIATEYEIPENSELKHNVVVRWTDTNRLIPADWPELR